MKAPLNLLLIFAFAMTSCSPLQPTTSTLSKDESLTAYKYFFITPTESLTSSTGSTYGNQYYSTTKTINPADVIGGIMLKKGFVKLPELKQDLLNQTLVVNYGESGRKSKGLGYSIEVTVQFIAADTNKLISSCTAEGMGETEADDIRIAINKCLNIYK
jgi:hypothetical protein